MDIQRALSLHRDWYLMGTSLIQYHEDKHMAAGKNLGIFETHGWRGFPSINALSRQRTPLLLSFTLTGYLWNLRFTALLSRIIEGSTHVDRSKTPSETSPLYKI